MPATERTIRIEVAPPTAGAATSVVSGLIDRADPSSPLGGTTASATLVVGHGAGASMTSPWMTGFARAARDLGITVVRFNFPYSEAGRKFPDRPPTAIATWRAVMAAVRDEVDAGTLPAPVWAGGKSYGGRMASLAVADGMDAAGLVFLGYPLHPPGKPEKARDEHLDAIAATPMLFLQGRNDPFATPNAQLDDLVARLGPAATLEWVEGAAHSFEVAGTKRTDAASEALGASVAPRVEAYLRARARSAGE